MLPQRPGYDRADNGAAAKNRINFRDSARSSKKGSTLIDAISVDVTPYSSLPDNY